MDGYPVVIDVEPRFRDTDAMGHLNNVVYLTYFEVVRAAYWQRLTGERDYRKVTFILAHLSVDFRSEGNVGEILRVGMRVIRLGTSSFEAEYRIEEQGQSRLVAEGRSVMVMYDYQRTRTYAMPEDLKEKVRALEHKPRL